MIERRGAGGVAAGLTVVSMWNDIEMSRMAREADVTPLSSETENRTLVEYTGDPMVDHACAV